MKRGYECTRLLITVMTYPHPSRRYRELVCTAGITQSGEWVRLYPVDYRYLPSRRKFRKFQWVDVGLSTHGHRNDPRRESRRPDLDTLRIIGAPLSAKDKWRERRQVVDRLPHHTLSELKSLYETQRVSLGIVRPKRVLDVAIRKARSEWKPEWRSLYTQIQLFEPHKPLRKLPFTFHYVFECDDSERTHRALITDWELGVLFLKESDRLGSDKAAADSVKQKYLATLCGPRRDTRFFMGTRLPYNAWMVVGVFWPPKRQQEPHHLFT